MYHRKTLLFSFCSGDIYFLTHISCLRVVAHSRVLGKIISVMYHDSKILPVRPLQRVNPAHDHFGHIVSDS